MKCKIPEISWHNRDPVLSVDIQPNCDCTTNKNDIETYRLATGGTDAHVLIWYMHLNKTTSELEMELAADLTRHQRAVNAVKWSPNGQLLASGDDESAIFIWKQKEESECLNILENTSDDDKEIWLTMKVLRGHMEDIYDLSWSPNSELLVSGSVDNTAIIWNIKKGKSLAILSDHKGFVQGVSWDPLNQYIATLSTDSYLRIFDIQTRKVVHRVNKSTLPVPKTHELYDKNCRLYYDDTLQTFFRRLCFTPDGKLLITPAGVVEYEDATHPLNTSYIFSRYALKQPAILLPSPEQYTVAVGCCPLLFKLREHTADNPPVIPLPYRMIFAIATRCSIYFYDTQQLPPFAVISNIHYTRLTDITWSHNGRIVVVSSTDGFCSLITFDADELGEEYIKPEKETKETTEDKNKDAEKLVVDEETTKNIPINTPEIILDKEILSSADKFQTPAKKSVNATVIAIRRHPRPPSEIYGKEISKMNEKVEDENTNNKAGEEQESQNSQTVENTSKDQVDSTSFEKKAICTEEIITKESMGIENETKVNEKLIEQKEDFDKSEGTKKLMKEQKENLKATEQIPEPEKDEKEIGEKVSDEKMELDEPENGSKIEKTEQNPRSKEDKVAEDSKKEVLLKNDEKNGTVVDEKMELDEPENGNKIEENVTGASEQNQTSKEEKVAEDSKIEVLLKNDKKEIVVDEKMELDDPENENKIEENVTSGSEQNQELKEDKEAEDSKQEVLLKKTDTEKDEKEIVSEEKMELDENKIEKNVADESAIKNSAEKTKDHEPTDKLVTPNQKYLSPNERTPRRVALRTISTPKSKKKLLD